MLTALSGNVLRVEVYVNLQLSVTEQFKNDVRHQQFVPLIVPEASVLVRLIDIEKTAKTIRRAASGKAKLTFCHGDTHERWQKVALHGDLVYICEHFGMILWHCADSISAHLPFIVQNYKNFQKIARTSSEGRQNLHL